MSQREKKAYTANVKRNSRPGEGRKTRERSRRRWQQIFFVIIAAILILSWILSLVVV